MSTDFRVLLVEDDEPKLRALADFISETWRDQGLRLVEARSHASAIRALDAESFDLAVLDMSLPSFDLARDTQGGGPPLGFGGRELLRHLEAEAPSTKAVVVTQYPNFLDSSGGARTSFGELDGQLRDEFGSQFLGAVFYEGKQGLWRTELKLIVSTYVLGKTQ